MRALSQSANKAWALMNKGAKDEKNTNIIFSTRLIIINMNVNMTKQNLKKNYDKVKYQLFSVASSYETHWQGNFCLKTLVTTLKRT